MKSKILKKSVDSIRERKSRRSFVLDIKKISKKRSITEILKNNNAASKKTLPKFYTNRMLFIKKPVLMPLAQKSAMKITAGILIISLNWLGIFAIGRTTAYFIDSEISQGNIFSAGTLDFSLTSPTDDFVPQDECDDSDNEDDIGRHANNGHNDDCKKNGNGHDGDFKDDNGSKNLENEQALENNDKDKNFTYLMREVQIEKIGSMDFQYAPSIKDIAGDLNFCDNLTLQVKLADKIIYSGIISNFNFENNPFAISEKGADIWSFIITIPDTDNEHYGKNNKNRGNDGSCQFDFSFRAWQLNLGREYGFGTEKEIHNVIELNSSDDENDKDNKNSSNESPENTLVSSPIPIEEQNTPADVETPAIITPAPENSNNNNDKPAEKDERELKNWNQDEDISAPKP